MIGGERARLAAVGGRVVDSMFNAVADPSFIRDQGLDLSPTPFAVLDDQGRIIAVNEAWRRFGRDNGADARTIEGVGLSYLSACRAAQGDDDSARDAFVAISELLAGKRERFELDYRCHSEREARWFQLQGRACRDGRAAIVLFHQDITALHQAQAQLRVQQAVASALS